MMRYPHLDVKHVRKLRRLVELLAKLSRAAYGFGYCRCGIPPRLHQRYDEGTLQIQLSLLTLGALGQTGKKVQAPA